MEKQDSFLRSLFSIAIPVALQSLLQSSFSIVDQIMVGQMGEVMIVGAGLAGKFASLYSVLLSAIAAVAGILISQNIGKKDKDGVSRNFYLNTGIALGLAVLFIALCEIIPDTIMGLYSTEAEVRDCAVDYLRIVAVGFVPVCGSLMLSTILRCKEKATVPLYATISTAAANTLLNYVLIFGKFGFPALGVKGAALATIIAQYVGFFVILGYSVWYFSGKRDSLPFRLGVTKSAAKEYLGILAPIIICEFMWSLGENVYAAIYGRIGTNDCAAMTLIGPVIMLFMGLLSGISQAAGIIIGKDLGAEKFDDAYRNSKKMMLYGFIGSLILSVLVISLGGFYVKIYNVDDEVKKIGYHLLIAFAVIAPVKVQNMITGGGIIRSGGKTKYLMVIDLVGTWVFGVPLGLITAFVFHLPITPVYFILSLEECVRLAMVFFVFRSRKWMVKIEN
ncbi:MAG: MATE family efflux transporter [Eubacteriales bacterium]|nr:MATE family efflux transporter [Eubacteriales bacterium]